MGREGSRRMGKIPEAPGSSYLNFAHFQNRMLATSQASSQFINSAARSLCSLRRKPMAISLFGGRRSDDPFESMLFDPFSFPSVSSLMRSSFPEHVSFARDVAAVANTQVDWKETADSHVFKANLPGLAKDDVKVQVEDGHVLQISGERKKEESSSNDRWHRVERAQGSFLRRFRLPDNAKVEEVKAAMENGVLTVTVPKLIAPPESKAAVKSIDISG